VQASEERGVLRRKEWGQSINEETNERKKLVGRKEVQVADQILVSKRKPKRVYRRKTGGVHLGGGRENRVDTVVV